MVESTCFIFSNETSEEGEASVFEKQRQLQRAKSVLYYSIIEKAIFCVSLLLVAFLLASKFASGRLTMF